ncbi:hypothetical protein ElyMa_000440700 [Elysia marginata]|uniref:Uncharacterized protein n=1 Tax=Elysia marginata TaxID=1093978 RepID=A0AAV4FQB5_9GAST|nr:hypothetical protein ElyMa_000440700 [Elysia marginata]
MHKNMFQSENVYTMWNVGCTQVGLLSSKEHCVWVLGYSKKRGHWQAVCRNRPQTKVETVTHTDEGECSEEEIIIYALSSHDAHDKWKEKLKMNNQDLQFRIDTEENAT